MPMRYDPCPLALAEIEALQADGIRLLPADILRINALAQLVEQPHIRLALSRGRPVAAGNAQLWPLTLAGVEWFQEVGAALGGTSMQTYALAYAMAHSSAPMPPLGEAKAAVKAWAKTLRCREQTLIEAIRQVLAQEEDGEIDPKAETAPATGGDISVLLAAMTRTAPEVWEYQCSMSYVLDMLQTMAAQSEAEGKSLRNDPKLKAERALGLAVWRIRERERKKAVSGT